jgi:hypothetical protein
MRPSIQRTNVVVVMFCIGGLIGTDGCFQDGVNLPESYNTLKYRGFRLLYTPVPENLTTIRPLNGIQGAPEKVVGTDSNDLLCLYWGTNCKEGEACICLRDGAHTTMVRVGSDTVCDVSLESIFPDSDADPDNAANYDFEALDAHIESIKALNTAEVLWQAAFTPGEQGICTTSAETPGMQRGSPISSADDADAWKKVAMNTLLHLNNGTYWDTENGQQYSVRYVEFMDAPQERLGYTDLTSLDELHLAYQSLAGAIKGYWPDAAVTGKDSCVPTCSPNCDAKVCGNNGCGGSCGLCGAGTYCVDSTCVTDCAPNCPDDANCIPDCEGKRCGDDACGGSCGSCTLDKPYCAQARHDTGSTTPVIYVGGISYLISSVEDLEYQPGTSDHPLLQFIDHCITADVPLDFVSFRTRTTHPYESACIAKRLRHYLDNHKSDTEGTLKKTKLILVGAEFDADNPDLITHGVFENEATASMYQGAFESAVRVFSQSPLSPETCQYWDAGPIDWMLTSRVPRVFSDLAAHKGEELKDLENLVVDSAYVTSQGEAKPAFMSLFPFRQIAIDHVRIEVLEGSDSQGLAILAGYDAQSSERVLRVIIANANVHTGNADITYDLIIENFTDSSEPVQYKLAIIDRGSYDVSSFFFSEMGVVKPTAETYELRFVHQMAVPAIHYLELSIPD